MPCLSAAHVVCLVALSGPGADLPTDDCLRQAEAAFREGVRLRDDPEPARAAFRRSARLYDELRRRGAGNADLYLNQGNAHSLAGELPAAVLAYRRGLALDPDNGALRARLESVRELVAANNGPAGRPPADDWPPWLPRLSPLQRLLAALGFFALACVGVTRWRMTRRTRPLVLAVLAAAVASLAGASLAIEDRARPQEAEHPLVVVAKDNVVLRKGNGDDDSGFYPPHDKVPRLNGGVEARLLFTRANHNGVTWHQIELAGGAVGWVRDDQVLIDGPPSGGG